MKKTKLLKWVCTVAVGLGISAAHASSVEWSPTTHIAISGNFDGVGEDDLYLQAIAGGYTHSIIDLTNGGAMQRQNWDLGFLGVDWTQTIVAGDFNNDGNDDLFLQANQQTSQSAVIFANSDGTFGTNANNWTSSYLGLEWSSDNYNVIAGNFHSSVGDGLLLQGKSVSHPHTILKPDGAGGFTKVTIANDFLGLNWIANVRAIHAGDFDGDGDDDLFLQGKYISIPLPLGANGALVPIAMVNGPIGAFAVNDGNGNFALGQTWEPGYLGIDWDANKSNVIIGDYNGDGRDDLMLQAKNSTGIHYKVLSNASSSTPYVDSYAANWQDGYLNIAWSSVTLVSGDFDGDGSDDLVAQSSGSNVLVNNNLTTTVTSAFNAPANSYLQSAVGTSQGAFEVSNGAAAYSIPIVVAPGTAGMEPSLSLAYSSQGGNGSMGVGWSLQGLSAITRCPATLVTDGFIDGVDFDSNDRFCMDGQRLILVSGTYGANNSEYRTEIDGFTKIVAYENDASNPGIDYFKVWTKSGQQMYFGNASTARFSPSGAPGAMVWFVNKIYDTVNNYMEMTYAVDSSTGEVFPSQVNFTGNDVTGQSADNRVEFIHDTLRPDTTSGYMAGYAFSQRRRLTKVRSFQANNLVRDYLISYETSTSTNKSRVSSITECSASSCFPALTFDWLDRSSTYTDWDNKLPGTYPTSAQDAELVRAIDFDGDGLMDRLRGPTQGGQWHWVRSTGTGYEDKGLVANYSHYDWFRSHLQVQHFLDVNGDGLQDVVLGPDNFGRWSVLENTGSALIDRGTWFTGFNQFAPNYCYAGDCNTADADFATIADVDGDGLQDIVLGPDNSGRWYVLKSTGTDLVDGGEWINATYATHRASWLTHAIDFNGDGRTDIINRHPTDASVVILESTGTSFVEKNISLPGLATGGAWNNAYYTPIYLDANGDGLQDLIYGPAGGQFFVWLNTGTTFSNQGQWIDSAISTWWDDKFNLVRIADIDADGYQDIVFGPKDNGDWIWVRSTGSSLQNKGEMFNGYASWWDDGYPIDMMDVTGDGLPDIALGPDASGNWYIVNADGFTPDLMGSLQTAPGVSTSITYKPLTDASVYSKGSANVSLPTDALDLQLPMPVVAASETDDGLGNSYNTSYFYRGLRAHRGRGILGFAEVDVTDQETGITSHTEYWQTFPYTGMAKYQQSSHATHGVLSWVSNSFANKSLNGGATVFPYVQQSQELSYELGNSNYTTQVITDYAYDDWGNALTVTVATNGYGQSVYTKHTANVYAPTDTTNWLLGRLTRATVTSTHANGSSATRVSSFQYHASNGLLLQEVVEPDNSTLALTTTYNYDNYGNKTSVTVSGTGISSRTTSTNYDSKGQFPLSTTNALGHTEYYVHDPKTGQRTSLTGPNNLTTQWIYDDFGRKTKELRADGTETNWSYYWCELDCPAAGLYYVYQTQTAGADAVVYYDKLAREIGKGSVGFDGQWIYSDTEYNHLGQISRQSRNYYAFNTVYWTSYTYDILGRVTDTVYPDGRVDQTTYNGLSVETRTDVYGKNLYKLEEKDAIGQLVHVQEHDTSTGQYPNNYYTYDAFGNLITLTDDAGNVTTMTYDIRGRKQTMVDPDMGYWQYDYNVLGELTWQKDAKNQIVTMTYDKLGRMVSRTEPEGTSTWTYDTAIKGIGKLAQVDGPNGFERVYIYDSLGRSEWEYSTIRQGTPEEEMLSTQRTYVTGTGQIDTETFHTGVTLKYYYNSRGYLYRVDDQSVATKLWEAHDADADGHILYETLGNGLATVRMYNPYNGLLEGISTGFGASSAVQYLTYQFDTLGNLLSREDANQTLTENFSYDGLNRLKSASINGATNRTYSYDSIGNITNKSDVGAMAYGASTAGPHAVSSANGSTYAYDANGNNTGGGGRNLTWSSFNKPTQITKGNHQVNFEYDADHVRTVQEKRENGVLEETTYYLNPRIDLGMHYEREIDHASGVTKEKHYVNVTSQRVMIVLENDGTTTTRKTRYMHTDHLGSTDTITDENGAVVERQSFSPFGARRNVTDWSDPISQIFPQETHHGFTGHEHLDGVGLIHMNGRVYDPVLGRFLSADPNVQLPKSTQGLNRYTYLNNNPLNATDPSGFFLSKLFKGIKKLFKRKIFSAIASFVMNLIIPGSGYLLTAIKTVATTVLTNWAMHGGSFKSAAIITASDFLIEKVVGVSVGGSGGGCSGKCIVADQTKRNVFFNSQQIAQRVARAITQGVVAKLGGDKFVNGARSGAFSRLYIPSLGSSNIALYANANGGGEDDNGKLHQTLEVISYGPIIGSVAAGIDAIIYTVEGNWSDAGIAAFGILGPVGKAFGKGLRVVARGKGLGNPFKDKSAKEIDQMFKDKGFDTSGPDPLNGIGGYVNPKTGRSYHIDPKEYGKYREPNHVDVNRLRDYKGPLDKKKLRYKED